MGTGKTWVAGAVIRYLEVPTLVVAPKVAVASWQRVLARMGTSATVLNYEMLRTGRTPCGSWLPLRGNQKHAKFQWHSQIQLLVLDEFHRCKAEQSQNSRMAQAARDCNIPTLVLSATIADSPLDMKALAYLARWHDGNFWAWARRYGCYRGHFGGLEFVKTEEVRRAHLRKLHALLFPNYGVRVRVAELGDAFPETQITCELYDTPHPDQIDALYAEISSALAALHQKSNADADLEHPLTRILRARQKLELLKVPVFEELYRDALAQGFHVPIFVNFSETLRVLSERLNIRDIVDGSQTGPAGERFRQECLARFQADEIPGILLNVKAGGVSLDLHDLHGNFPRLALISPTYSAYDFRQVVGRVRRIGAKTKSLQRIVLAANSIEVQVHKQLSRKLDNLDLLIDGDFVPQQADCV
jgi:superfamily II DNA or RNA helicase